MPDQESIPHNEGPEAVDKARGLSAATQSLKRHHINVHSAAQGIALVEGDVIEVLNSLVAGPLRGQVDVIIADPPYFIGKADWDGQRSLVEAVAFHEEWLSLCRELLAEHGTLWACGNFDSLPALGYAIKRVGLRLLCDVVWTKTNPRPNTARRCFSFATESLLWSAKHHSARYRFNYGCIREQNGGKQMTTNWRMPTVRQSEKVHGHHPTQKPLALIERCIESTTGLGDLVLDPFIGSGTTAVAALRHGRYCIGIDQDATYLDIADRRVRVQIAAVSAASNVSANDGDGG